ncbi:MAG: DUF1211 domain-containing protein [Pseudonocardiales bacterium]|nr:MAG: DUF1211 domain-containing protein [Pseudonocardiales bacterium]
MARVAGAPPRPAERLEGFSDAVFAIAITLLALDVRVVGFRPGHLGAAVGHLWPQLLAYAATFLIVGQVWASHHGMFRWIDRADHVLLLLDVGMLGCIALQPFPTSLVATALSRGTARDVALAVSLYSGLLFVGGVFYNGVWRYAARRGLLVDGLDPGRVRWQARRYGIGVLVYLVAAAVAFVSVPVAIGLDLALAVGYLIPSPNLRPRD